MNDRPTDSTEPLSLLPQRQAPQLPGTVVIGDTVEELVEQMSVDLLAHSLNCVRTFGDFHLALCGGTTPIPFYRHLMIDPICRGVPWRKTHLWLVDEHSQSTMNEDSTWTTIADFLMEHSGIPLSQQHPIDTSAEQAAEQYEAELRRALEWREKGQDRLDYVLLGVDEKGGVAGQFELPKSVRSADCKRLITARQFAEPGAARFKNEHWRNRSGPSQRITMTFRLINAARFVAVMVTGPGKRGIIEHLVNSHSADGPARKDAPLNIKAPNDCTLPILGIHPVAGNLRWYLDKSACPIVK